MYRYKYRKYNLSTNQCLVTHSVMTKLATPRRSESRKVFTCQFYVSMLPYKRTGSSNNGTFVCKCITPD